MVPVGRYSLRAFTGNLSGVNVTIGLQSTNVPTRLQADVWGSGGVRLNWDDNSNNEASYRVDRWTRLGWRRSVRVGADATAAVIGNLQPNSATTYRVSLVTADGIGIRSANIASATTAPVSTDGWYKVKLSAGVQGEAGWTLAKDMLGMTPTTRENSNGMESKWVRASSWQMAVWSTVASWDNSTISYAPVAIATGEKDEDNNPIYQKHSFPSGGDFKVGTGSEIKNALNVQGFDLGDNDTKYIVLEDSYGSIDRDYDDFYWKVSVVGIKAPELKLQQTTFIKQDHLETPGEIFADTAFQGDNRGNNGSAIFEANHPDYRTRHIVSVYPMDVYWSDTYQKLESTTSASPRIGLSAQYDRPSSVVNGLISGLAKSDTSLNDGYLKIAEDRASSSGLTLAYEDFQKGIATLVLTGGVNNPLRASPEINYETRIELDYTDPLNPKYRLSSLHDLFPCYEFAIDGVVVMDYDSGHKTPWELFLTNPIPQGTQIGDLPKPEFIVKDF